jgi:hypothetical protein
MLLTCEHSFELEKIFQFIDLVILHSGMKNLKPISESLFGEMIRKIERLMVKVDPGTHHFLLKKMNSLSLVAPKVQVRLDLVLSLTSPFILSYLDSSFLSLLSASIKATSTIENPQLFCESLERVANSSKCILMQEEFIEILIESLKKEPVGLPLVKYTLEFG